MNRHAFIAIVLSALLIYGGLFPFQGWTTGDALAFLSEKSPPVSNNEDILINILVFIPLGISTTLALNRRYRLTRSVLLSITHGFLISFIIEAFQAFLPTRYSSITDLLMNTLGTSIGSLGSAMAILHAYRSRDNINAWFASSAQAHIALASAAAWASIPLLPFDPTTDLSAVVARLTSLLPTVQREATLSMGIVLINALTVLGLGLLLRAAARHARRPWIALSLILAFLLRLFMGDHGMRADELFGVILGALLLLAYPSTTPRNYAIGAAVAILASFVCSELLPGSNGVYRTFNWIPFKPHLRSPVMGLGALLEEIWTTLALVACALFLVRARSWRLIAGVTAGLVLFGFALEWCQTGIPGRMPDVTTPLVMGAVSALTFLTAGIHRRSTDLAT